MKKQVKKFFNQLLQKFNLRMIRLNYLPWGFDMFNDLEKLYPLKNFMTIFDVGANVGQSTIIYIDKFKNGKIYSFEPVYATFQKLKKATSTNKNVSCFHTALGEFKGSQVIPLQEKSTLNSLSSTRNATISEGDETEEIKIEKLDQIFLDLKLSEIDFLKIDTEGFEMEVLKGAENTLQQGKIKFILLELGIKKHPRTTFYNDVSNYLSLNGYDVVGFYKQSSSLYTKGRFLMHSDVLFVNSDWSKTLRPNFVKSYEFD